MSDVHAYRASDELAAALRQFRKTDDEFAETIVAFDKAHPGNELLWVRSGFSADRRAVGFSDRNEEVPPGLSRAKTRVELRPKKNTKAGRPWQAVLDEMNQRPKVQVVFSAFGVPNSAWGATAPSGGQYVSSTKWVDAGDDGVIVFNLSDLSKETFDNEAGHREHLTAVPLSEFYAIKERLETEQVSA